MTQLAIRENWFEDLVELRRGFDQLFNRLLTGWPAGTEPERSPFAFVPPAEVWVDKEAKKYHLRLALPGVDPSTLSRTLTLPERLDTEQINAEYDDGLLEITTPVAAAALPREVEIKGLPKAKAA